MVKTKTNMGSQTLRIAVLFVLIAISLLLLIVGAATNNWIVAVFSPRVGWGTYGSGLFRYCYGDSCEYIDTGSSPSDEYSDVINATRACCMLGVFFSGVAIVLFSFWIVKKFCKKVPNSPGKPEKWKPVLVSAALCLCAGGFTLIGLVVFHLKWPTHLFGYFGYKGYSFYLSVAGNVLIVLSGILLLFVHDKPVASSPQRTTQAQDFSQPPVWYHTQSQQMAIGDQQLQQPFQWQQGRNWGKHPQHGEEQIAFGHQQPQQQQQLQQQQQFQRQQGRISGKHPQHGEEQVAFGHQQPQQLQQQFQWQQGRIWGKHPQHGKEQLRW